MFTITKYTGTKKDVIIPSKINGISVIDISYEAFTGNKTIESIVIPNTVININAPIVFYQLSLLVSKVAQVWNHYPTQ